MNDPELVELYRAADEADARSGAKWAAADVARSYELDNPLYIARVIEGELRRFEERPRQEDGLDRQPLVPTDWVGAGPLVMSTDELREWVDEAEASDAAKAAAILVVRAFPEAFIDHYRRHPHRLLGVVGTFGPLDHPILYRKRIIEVAELIQKHLDAPEFQAHLDEINVHRRALGMPLLDPVSAGWTAQDVQLEAERIGRLSNPVLELMRRVL